MVLSRDSIKYKKSNKKNNHFGKMYGIYCVFYYLPWVLDRFLKFSVTLNRVTGYRSLNFGKIDRLLIWE